MSRQVEYFQRVCVSWYTAGVGDDEGYAEDGGDFGGYYENAPVMS
jgi:hypothetical protein